MLKMKRRYISLYFCCFSAIFIAINNQNRVKQLQSETKKKSAFRVSTWPLAVRISKFNPKNQNFRARLAKIATKIYFVATRAHHYIKPTTASSAGTCSALANSKFSNAIPLGMEQTVEKHPCLPKPSFRRNVSKIFLDTFLTECVAPRALPISTERFIPNGMKNASDL
jgi:hypothetical protein